MANGFKSGSGNLGKVGAANHDHHTKTMGSFAGIAAPKPGSGGQRFEQTASGGMRSQAQQSSVKKAAAKSALVRGERATTSPLSKASSAPMTSPRTPNAAKQGVAPGLSTGGISLANKKGLLSL